MRLVKILLFMAIPVATVLLGSCGELPELNQNFGEMFGTPVRLDCPDGRSITITFKDGRVPTKRGTPLGMRIGIPMRITYQKYWSNGLCCWYEQWMCADPITEDMARNNTNPINLAEVKRRIHNARTSERESMR